ncbi:MAG: hypothetical protein ABSE81_07600 [Candidatus Omnitrophota bacterium]|jgi:Zn-dependent protease with chaperone function
MKITLKIMNLAKGSLLLALFISPFLFKPLLYGADNQATQESGTLAPETHLEESGQVIKSAYFSIYASANVDLRRVYKRLNLRYFDLTYGRRPDSLASWEEKIAYRMDLLMERVKQLLDIYPEGLDLKVRIFKTYKELNDAHYAFSGIKGDYKAFYVHNLRTIYVSEETISDSVIAHEMAHVVADHYFKVVPPETISEMIAQYVNLHLDD